MPKKVKPTARPSKKLVEGAREYVLRAYDQALQLLTQREQLELAGTLLRRFKHDESRRLLAFGTIHHSKRFERDEDRRWRALKKEMCL